MSDQPVYLLGAGGHGRVVLDALLAAGVRVLGILDPGLTAGSLLNSVPVLGADAQLDRLDPASARLAIGVGANPATARRAEMFAVATKRGWAMATVRHPSVIAAADCAFADGCQLMAGAVIQCGTRIGANAVINTAASIDHDCSIGEHAFVSPGATLCGDVHLGEARSSARAPRCFRASGSARVPWLAQAPWC